MVAAKFAGTAGLDEILQLIAYSAADAMDTDGSVVFLPSERHPGQMEAAVVHNIPGLKVGDLLSMETSLTGLTYKTGQTQISTQVSSDTRVDPKLVAVTKTQTV